MRRSIVVEIFDKHISDVGFQQPEQVTWRKAKASPVFVDHYWIEPGELIEEEVLIALPAGSFNAYKLTLRVNTPKTTITTSSVIDSFSQQTDHPSQQSLLPRGYGT